jgi:hypothetical protein
MCGTYDDTVGQSRDDEAGAARLNRLEGVIERSRRRENGKRQRDGLAAPTFRALEWFRRRISTMHLADHSAARRLQMSEMAWEPISIRERATV